MGTGAPLCRTPARLFLQQPAIDRIKATRRFDLARPLIAPRLPAPTVVARTSSHHASQPALSAVLRRELTVPSHVIECMEQVL